MSRWTHNICSVCWHLLNPGRTPHQLTDGPVDLCCFCGTVNRAGIYVRQSPQDPLLLCKGNCDAFAQELNRREAHE